MRFWRIYFEVSTKATGFTKCIFTIVKLDLQGEPFPEEWFKYIVTIKPKSKAPSIQKGIPPYDEICNRKNDT
jgi:hypothetical protein